MTLSPGRSFVTVLRSAIAESYAFSSIERSERSNSAATLSGESDSTFIEGLPGCVLAAVCSLSTCETYPGGSRCIRALCCSCGQFYDSLDHRREDAQLRKQPQRNVVMRIDCQSLAKESGSFTVSLTPHEQRLPGPNKEATSSS